MLFHVQMDVKIPDTLPAEQADAIKAAEKARAIEIQQAGKWPHLWRVVGRYANVSIFDVESNDELHAAVVAAAVPHMTIQSRRWRGIRRRSERGRAWCAGRRACQLSRRIGACVVIGRWKHDAAIGRTLVPTIRIVYQENSLCFVK